MNMLSASCMYVFPGIASYDPVFIFMNEKTPEERERIEKAWLKAEKISGKQIRIVLADDDNDDRELFKEAVEEAALNINLDFAEDGRCLLNLLNNEKHIPDLIFLDLNMPHKNGMECLAEIRKNINLKNVPVIIYSTSSSIKDIDESYNLGANLYVKKPSSFNELKTITGKVLSLDWNKYKPHASRNMFLFSSKTE